MIMFRFITQQICSFDKVRKQTALKAMFPIDSRRVVPSVELDLALSMKLESKSKKLSERHKRRLNSFLKFEIVNFYSLYSLVYFHLW